MMYYKVLTLIVCRGSIMFVLIFYNALHINSPYGSVLYSSCGQYAVGHLSTVLTIFIASRLTRLFWLANIIKGNQYRSVVDFHRFPTSHIVSANDLVREIMVFFTSATTVANLGRPQSFIKIQLVTGLRCLLRDYIIGPHNYYRPTK